MSYYPLALISDMSFINGKGKIFLRDDSIMSQKSNDVKCKMTCVLVTHNIQA